MKYLAESTRYDGFSVTSAVLDHEGRWTRDWDKGKRFDTQCEAETAAWRTSAHGSVRAFPVSK